MPRIRLPSYRENETLALTAHYQPYTITINRTPKQITEVFISPKVQNGSDTANILHDVGVILSIALQWGVPLSELQRAILRLEDNTPASAIGAILDLLLNTQTTVPQVCNDD
jgi:hypothetical protein